MGGVLTSVSVQTTTRNQGCILIFNKFNLGLSLKFLKIQTAIFTHSIIPLIVIAAYIDSLVMISIKESKTNKKRALEIQDKFVPDHELCLRLGQCQVIGKNLV